jgi:hypothetical protein
MHSRLQPETFTDFLKPLLFISFMKFTQFFTALAAGILGGGALISNAQVKTTGLKKEIRPAILPLPISGAATLSGIDLKLNRNTGTFNLTFNQQLSSGGNLTVTDAKRQVIYSETLTPAADSMVFRSIDLGKLKAGLYQVEVKAGNVLYWKKLRVRR